MSTRSLKFSLLVSLADTDHTPVPAVRKLRSFAHLPNGWSHGEGRPVDASAIRAAEKFVEIATTLQLKVDVFPWA